MLRLGVRRSIAASAACLLAATATNLAAADGPGVTLDVTIDGILQSQILSGSSTSLPDVFNYQGGLSGGGWDLNWDFNASNSSNGGTQAFTAGNFVIQNFSTTDAIEVELTVKLPVALLGSALYGGSASGGLTTSGPGFLQDLDGPVWTGSTGGNIIATLFNNPFSVVRTEAGSSQLGAESFGNPIPSLPGPDLGADLSVTLKFLLGANSSASFTSVFVARVPAPGAFALLGLSGLTALSRRRRA